MEILDWIQHWFMNNCDGKWEKGEGIHITTIDNPGWQVEIDISKTPIAGISINTVLNENSRHDWYSVEIQQNKFNAEGDPGKLEFLLSLFKDMIEKMDPS